MNPTIAGINQLPVPSGSPSQLPYCASQSARDTKRGADLACSCSAPAKALVQSSAGCSTRQASTEL